MSAGQSLTTNQFGHWVEEVCRTYVALNVARVDDSPFRAGLDVTRLGDTVLAELHATALRADRRPAEIARAAGDYAILILQQAGTMIVAQDGRDVRLVPGAATVVDTTRPYTLYLSEPVRQIVLHCPRHQLESRVRSMRAVIADRRAARRHADDSRARAPRFHAARGRSRRPLCDRPACHGAGGDTGGRRGSFLPRLRGAAHADQRLSARQPRRSRPVARPHCSGARNFGAPCPPAVPRKRRFGCRRNSPPASGPVPGGSRRPAPARPFHHRNCPALGLQRQRPFQPRLQGALRRVTARRPGTARLSARCCLNCRHCRLDLARICASRCPLLHQMPDVQRHHQL
jgi:hypothetical protein